MDAQLSSRNLLLSGLVALALLASSFLMFAPNAAALDKSDCPSGKICLWAGPTFGGQQSFWNAWETGCHALANIDPRSAFNNTGNRIAQFTGGQFYSLLWPSDSFSNLSSGYTGHMCISAF